MCASALTAAAPPSSAPVNLATIRGDNYPPLGADPKKLATYVNTLLQDSEQEAQARYRRATQNLLFADGRQHIDWNLREKTWKELPNDGRIRVTMNYIKPILRSRAQRLLSSELRWRAIPRSNAHEERDRAAVGTNLLESRWEGEEMDAKARQAIFLADCCGVVYFKKFWNPDIGPLTPATVLLPHPQTQTLTKYPVDQQGNPLMDDQGNPLDGTELGFTYRPGDTDTALRTIFNVRLNPDAQGVEPAEGFRWLLDSEVVPISVVKERWGKRADKVQAVTGLAMMRQYQQIVKSVAGRPGTQTNELATGRAGQGFSDKDLTLLTEYWEAPTDSIKTGRLIVLAGEEVLYPRADFGDAEGLPNDMIPFVAIYSERRPFDGGGRPMVDDLIAPQKVVNSQWSGILEEQALHGAGQWIGFDVPGMFDQVSNLNASHIKLPLNSALANRGIGDLIQRVPPPTASPDRWRLIDAAKATMFDIGAFHEIQRGQVPPGVDSGIAVQLLQEAENGQMHDSVRGLKRSFIQWGRLTGKLAKWGYGTHEERWIPQQRPDLGFLVEAVTGEDLPDFDTLDIDLEGFRPHSQAALNAEIKEMMGNGWIDARRGLQLMDLGRGVEGAFESQNRHYARARRENLAIQKLEYTIIPTPAHSPAAELGAVGAFLHPDGMSFLLPKDDDHLIHIDIHQEIFLDDTRPADERKAAGLHIMEHRAILSQQLMAQQMAANPPEQGAASPKSDQSTKSPPTESGANDA